MTFSERTIESGTRRGETLRVEVPTHVAGVLDFAGGAVGTIIMSFDVWHANLPLLEIHGTTGSLSVPDPNGFGGPVRLRRAADKEWAEVPLTFDYAENSRGLGVADMAHAMRTGRPHRAGGELTSHVLDVMHALHESSEQARHIELRSTCCRPAPMAHGLPTSAAASRRGRSAYATCPSQRTAPPSSAAAARRRGSSGPAPATSAVKHASFSRARSRSSAATYCAIPLCASRRLGVSSTRPRTPSSARTASRRERQRSTSRAIQALSTVCGT